MIVNVFVVTATNDIGALISSCVFHKEEDALQDFRDIYEAMTELSNYKAEGSVKQLFDEGKAVFTNKHNEKVFVYITKTHVLGINS